MSKLKCNWHSNRISIKRKVKLKTVTINSKSGNNEVSIVSGLGGIWRE